MVNERCEQDRDKYSYLFLSSEDRANGFAIETDERNNITLLKGNEPIARFSRIMSEKTVNAFVELIKGYGSALKQTTYQNCTRKVFWRR